MNTLPDISYEIQSKTDLLQTNWNSEGFCLGSELTNFVEMDIAQGDRTQNLFFRIRSWADDTGTGIPDWWWLQYFGQFTNVNPYADNMGDGWSNLQKFQLGLSPTNFIPAAVNNFIAVLSTNETNVILSWSPSVGAVSNYAIGRYDFDWDTYDYDFTSLTPAGSNVVSYVDSSDTNVINGDDYDTYYQIQAVYTNGSSQIAYAGIQFTPSSPQGLIVTYNTNTGAANLSWQTSGGSVTGYTILRQTNSSSSFSPIATVSASQNSYTDTSYPGGYDEEYEIEADYAEGSSYPSGGENPRISPSYTVPASIVRGPSGLLYLAVSAIPQNVTAFRVYRTDNQASYYPISTFGTWWNETISIYTFEDPQLFNSGAGNGYFDIPVTNFVNGVYQLTSGEVPPYGTYSFQVQALAADGMSGEKVSTGYATGDAGRADYDVPFFDGRASIAQNINFLLMDVATNAPFNINPIGWPFYEYSYSGNSSYVFAGFHYCNNNNTSPLVLNEFQPFEENNYYENLLYAPANVDSGGNADTGAGIHAGTGSGSSVVWSYFTYTESPPTSYYFNTYSLVTGGSPSLSAALPDTTAQWISYVNPDNTNYTIPSEQNIYGLALESVKWPGNSSPPTFPTAYPGNVINFGSGTWFYQMASPSLSSNSYYFARHYIDPLPGESNFSVTNTTPSVIIASVGQPFSITAWAKQSLANGYSGKFAYAEQYFDKAYKANTSGNATTNQTGILSEYGEFFPTDAGKVILTTKSDGALGTVGQCAVNVIKLGLDVNHDGTIDTSFAGSDNTTAATPDEIWINNDYDFSSGSADPFGHDIENVYRGNYQDPAIACPRDLEDYFRLWICGMPALTNGSYQVTLSWTNVGSGSPAINLVNAVETNGGTLYLTDTNTAIAQCADSMGYGFGQKYATVSTASSLTLPSNLFTNAGNKYFLFEGAGIGSGELLLTIADSNGNTIAQTGAWFDIHDVKDFYEQAHAANVPTSPPSTNTSVLVEDKILPANPAEDQKVTVFVHGLNVGAWEYHNEAETMFKRLYWQGYHGRFAAFDWPSPVFAVIPTGTNEISYLGFNTGEYVSWHSGAALKAYIDDLHNRLTNYTVNLAVHSLGNVAANEAIKEGAQVDNYALMQAAISAGAFDGNNSALTYDYLATTASSSPGADTLGGYGNCFTNATRRVNFYNDDDFALYGAVFSSGTFHTWEGNQLDYKPDTYIYFGGFQYAYSFDGTNCFYKEYDGDGDLLSSRTVTEDFEKKAFVARSRTKAVGAAGLKYEPYALTGGLISTNISLQNTSLGFVGGASFGNTRSDHSGEFTKPIQNAIPFYRVLLDAGFDIAPKL